MSQEVFKIQKPIHSSSPDILCLVYNRDRSAYGEIPLTPELDALMGSSYKIYVKGQMNEDGFLEISHKIAKQRW